MDTEKPDLLHALEHYQQRYNWDCGLSCVLMVLPIKSRNYIINNFKQVVEEEGFGESTWTIDLCFLLHRFQTKFSYLTVTIGIDPGYIRENFYDKVLSKDSHRVNQRFSDAESLGMHLEKKSVPVKEIMERLKAGPIIVLVNISVFRVL
ncbi:protein GUCD1 isoform X2 [Eurytemora carolleeae]|uniref:protein GUCD1 isoform X2 n=1 Tax=Eurytemora carolleeae TaxID=1294199 RepID=UPI000C775618|nr:protein GUCD1 isoform X2 [Eurytemora carolleeae]|eukprot:XP_023342304.1 protein GUCD1-like isoform X2 [Eurytemora affinis]